MKNLMRLFQLLCCISFSSATFAAQLYSWHDCRSLLTKADSGKKDAYERLPVYAMEIPLRPDGRLTWRDALEAILSLPGLQMDRHNSFIGISVPEYFLPRSGSFLAAIAYPAQSPSISYLMSGQLSLTEGKALATQSSKLTHYSGHSHYELAILEVGAASRGFRGRDIQEALDPMLRNPTPIKVAVGARGPLFSLIRTFFIMSVWMDIFIHGIRRECPKRNC
ncbi:MAG: hypothetical protein R3A80_05235 [Bdellovibrionota bacterium]